MADMVQIKRSIIEDIISAVKTVLEIDTPIKPSEVASYISSMPREILAKYTNSDNVTNSTLQTLLQSVKQDTSSLVEAITFTDNEDTEDIIDEVIGGE